MTFRLADTLDPAPLAEAYAAAGRVRVDGFLAPAVAAALHERLAARADWRQVVNSGDKVFELDRATRAAMGADQAAALDDAVQRGAAEGFQYRYETIRLPDGDAEPPPGADPLAGWPRWLSRDPVRALLRRITGDPAIDFADGQATAYASGDMLTGHDDAVDGKRRRAAYVLGLTPRWRAEWGGLLLFHGQDGTIAGALPGFNTLDIFRVPQRHSVSLVAPAVPARRHAITGWLRSAG